jgi:hypothetical protein
LADSTGEAEEGEERAQPSRLARRRNRLLEEEERNPMVVVGSPMVAVESGEVLDNKFEIRCFTQCVGYKTKTV